jgi:DNA adenine methylase
MSLSSPLCRIGRKKPIQHIIMSVSPKQFNKYVEPFVGSGDIYFELNLDSSIPAVINDLDTEIATAFKILKSNPSIDNIERFKNKSLEDVRSFMKQSHSSPIDKLAKIIYDLCGTFGGQAQGSKIYKNPNIETKLRKIPKYAEYMKNTKVLNQDYKSVIKSNDSKDTYFYLDPPYESSKGLYTKSEFNYEELADVLSKVKGKFVLSLNDSPNIRNIFKQFKIRGIRVEGGGDKESIGEKTRKEVIIKNF